MEMNPVCKSCQNPISATYFFCPYCGKKLRQPPLSTTVGKQISIYLVAIFFPFFSVIPGIRYLRQQDSKSKAVGIVTLLLTGISLLVNVYYFFVFVDYFNQLLNAPLGIDTGLESLKSLQ